jgi:hypothetical protein
MRNDLTTELSRERYVVGVFRSNRALIYRGKKFGLRQQPLAVACVNSIY